MTSGSTKWSDRVHAAAAVGVFSDPVVEHLRKPARDRHFEPAAERIENRLISSTGGHRGERPRLVRPSVARNAVTPQRRFCFPPVRAAENGRCAHPAAADFLPRHFEPESPQLDRRPDLTNR